MCAARKSGAGFSLWGFDLARTKPHRLKPAPPVREITEPGNSWGRENGFLTVRAHDRGVYLPDLVLEFAVCDQGMGTRRGAAPRAHAAGRQGRGTAAPL